MKWHSTWRDVMAKTISALSRVLQLLAPRACSVCGCRLSGEEEVICCSCDLNLPRTNYASDAYENEMAKMFWLRIPIERAAALFFYHAHSKATNMIYELKYHGHPEIGEKMGIFAAREMSMANFFDGIDMIIPIPLAKKRMRQRGYNQSEWIAKGISAYTHIPVMTDVVERKSFSGSQTHLQRLGRADNVENVFHLLRPEVVRGKHVLLVDDVCTTGATIVACGKALEEAGDLRFSVFTLGLAMN